ncbi:serine/threonine protein kinase [Bombardia bombarda]|uniref:Serine/threonine protein kinase n=1 Tax=Bombardia bombarda TaxID=252184 RepID=A0AA39XNK2_9PEZI|nr:serine/threonine protein kinase [Bombardia bombarda]
MPNRPRAQQCQCGDLEPGPNSPHEQIQTLLSTANIQQLQKAALLARIGQGKAAHPDISCAIDTSCFTYGFNNVVLEVSFSDHVYWLAKTQHVSINASEATENAMYMSNEIATMRTTKNRTSTPVPQVFAYDCSPSNEVGYPYILMEFLHGRTLGGTIVSQVPPEHHPKVARQLADWFYTDRQESNRMVLDLHPQDPEWNTACWVLKTALPHIIVEDRVHGPFPLCHVDLHHGNILFDDGFNLTAVLDWSQAQTVPLERLAVSPEFITFPGISEERNQKILDFRSLVREHLQHLEKTECSADKISPTPLFHVFGSKRADITNRCTYSRPQRALWDGRMVARLMYGDGIAREQLVCVYGELEIY